MKLGMNDVELRVIAMTIPGRQQYFFFPLTLATKHPTAACVHLFDQESSFEERPEVDS